MYLVLSIVNGEQRGASHVFDRNGGLIGRSSACDWPLHDPSNTISGRHAAISFASDRYFITDNSTNGTFLNGSPTPIGKGRAAALQPGDQIAIGDLTIVAAVVDRLDEHAQQVAQAAPARSRAAPPADPMAALASAGGSSQQDVLTGLPGAAAPPAQRGAGSGLGPLGQMTGGSGRGDDILPLSGPGGSVDRLSSQQLVQGNPGPAPAGPSSPSQSDAGIPDHLSVEYLLSGKRAESAPQAAPPPPADPPVPTLPPESLAVPPPPVAVATPEIAPTPPQPAVPPAPASAPQPSGDLSPALRASYVALGDGEDPAAPGERPAALDPVSVLRQRSEGRDRPRAAPLPGPPTPPAPQPPAAVQAAPFPGVVNRRPAASAAPQPSAAEELVDTTTAEEAAAFWGGLGINPEHVPAERRLELLGEVGRSMRELGQGLVEVLAARRSLKQEFRIEQTRLQATENNPFKFFTSGEKALARIIVGEEGYMPLDEAVRESLQDIKAHEVAAMTALQSAVSHVLSQLDPQAVATTVGQRGVFGRGQDRKALWDKFVELHGELSGDVEGTARGIVSSAFMEAYERQLSQMRGDG